MTNKIKDIDSIIFDLDGTLWDPSNAVFNAWHEALNNETQIKNPISKKDLQAVFGMQDTLIGEILFPYLSEKEQDRIMLKCYNNENDYIRVNGGDLFGDLEKMLIELSSKYKLYIVSNCQDGYIEAFYAYHKLDKYFLDYECSGRSKKPKAENIKDIISRNNLNSPIYVGDTITDFMSTLENNIPFVYASYGFGEVDEYIYKIDSIGEILSIIEE